MPDRSTVRADDIQPGAYVTSDGRLYQIVRASGLLVTVENCKTGQHVSLARSAVLRSHLVQAAPSITVPDYPPADHPQEVPT